MPETLGQYTLGDRIAGDAVGDVFRALDTSLGRTVAVKVLKPSVAADSAQREPLLAAARRAQPLSHPNIVELFDIGEQRGRHFLVFEHVAGESLRATIAGTPLNVRRAVDLGIQIADAVAEAHGRAIAHRGLRPEAILITSKGRPKIVDFGLLPPAALRRSGQAFEQMSPEDVECLSPEQVLGELGDERTDVFAFGCVMFEMLTGTSPFSAATAADTAVAILGRTPPPPSQMNARVPEALDRLVERCLAKSLDRRVRTAAEVASALREIAVQLETDDRTGGWQGPMFAAHERRSRAPLIVMLVVVLAAFVVAAFLFSR